MWVKKTQTQAQSGQEGRMPERKQAVNTVWLSLSDHRNIFPGSKKGFPKLRFLGTLGGFPKTMPKGPGLSTCKMKESQDRLTLALLQQHILRWGSCQRVPTPDSVPPNFPGASGKEWLAHQLSEKARGPGSAELPESGLV